MGTVEMVAASLDQELGRELSRISRELARCEELLRIIESGSPDFSNNRLGFTLIMHAAVQHCGLDIRLLARLGNTSPQAIERYVSGQSATGTNIQVPGHGVCNVRHHFIDMTVTRLLKRKIPRLRVKRDRILTKLEIEIGLVPDLSEYDDTNVALFAPWRE